jgi:hypothetical protein
MDGGEVEILEAIIPQTQPQSILIGSKVVVLHGFLTVLGSS